MSEWKKVKIGDICKIVKGTTGIASAEPGEYPLVVTAEERKTCSTYQFDCEAVCIPLVSSSGHGKKSLKNVHYQSGKFALGTILCAVIPNNPQELDARYLHQYLQFYKDIILVPLMKGAANVSLSMKDIATVEFSLPPIERQRELSNLFVSLQEKQKELSAEYEKQTEYAKLLRQNILQQAIEGKFTAAWRKQNPVQKGNPDYDTEALFEQLQKGDVSPSLQPATQFSATPSAGSNAARNARSKSLTPITEKEKPFEIPEGWKWVRLEEVTITIGNKTNQIQTKEILEDGLVAVVSQGQELIDGYSNETDKTIDDLPLIMFGDHTRNVKYIDFPFVIGADGTKFFKPICVNPKYLLYLVQFAAQKIRNRGYARHYVLLKKIPLSLPPLKEQEEIVNKVEILLAKVTTLENQIQYRKSLSDKLIFGIIKENLEGKKC